MSKASKPVRATKKIVRRKAKPKAAAATKERTPRTDSKQAKLIAMLRRPEGASIAEAVAALEWQAHTVRGAIAGALKKKLGLKVESEKVDSARGRVYRLCGAPHNR